MHRSILRVPALLSGIALASLSFGQTAPFEHRPVAPLPAADPMHRVKEEVLRMTEFFDNILPGTVPGENVIIDFSPKFSDLRDEEYVRVPFLLKWGVNSRWELAGGLTPYFPNPINNGVDHRWGLGEARVGARYNLGKIPGLYHAVTLGLEVRTPLGKPPIEIIDHYSHVRPGLSAARTLPIPFTTFFTDISYDRQFGRPNPIPFGVLERNVTEIAPGLLFKPGQVGWFADYRWRHFDEPTNAHRGHEYKFGGLWDVPIATSQGNWGLPGKFQVELAYKSTAEDGRPTDSGVSARVRWRTSLREILSSSWQPSEIKTAQLIRR